MLPISVVLDLKYRIIGNMLKKITLEVLRERTEENINGLTTTRNRAPGYPARQADRRGPRLRPGTAGLPPPPGVAVPAGRHGANARLVGKVQPVPYPRIMKMI